MPVLPLCLGINFLHGSCWLNLIKSPMYDSKSQRQDSTVNAGQMEQEKKLQLIKKSYIVATNSLD
jgi:hypothetical protein